MNAKLNELNISFSEEGYPYWIRIGSGRGEVSIHHDELPFLIEILKRGNDHIQKKIKEMEERR
jgi:hypothetical protein